MLMKRILRFLPLRINLCRTYLYDVNFSIYNNRMFEFVYAVFNYIMPVKSERFNTKIYIFERYRAFCASCIVINDSKFTYNTLVLKPVLQKK